LAKAALGVYPVEVTTTLMAHDGHVVALRLVGSVLALVATVNQYLFAPLAVFSESSPEVAKANVDVSKTFTNKFVEQAKKTTGMNAK
jgi:hypothetical protein